MPVTVNAAHLDLLMPALFVHLSVAARAVIQVGLAAGEQPAYLLGCIAADVDKINGQPRATTHFWTGDEVSGAIKLLAAHPHLLAARVAPAERAFIAGYLCHLVTDEQWTFTIWRPHFGRYSPYKGGPEGAALQRALHAVLETREQQRASHAVLDRVALLNEARHLYFYLRSDLLPFARLADVDRLREAVVTLARLTPGADRMRFWESIVPAMPCTRPTGKDQAATPAWSGLAARQAYVSRYVTEQALSEFDERAVAASAAISADYLAGRPLQPPAGTAAPSPEPQHTGPRRA